MIGTVAALRPEKNLARLLRAFRLVADVMPARLVIVGRRAGAAGAGAARRANSGWAGRCGSPGMSTIPRRCTADFDVFALSSDTEQMPLSVIEAMAAGLPVAATDVGDVAAMLAAENRAFVTPTWTTRHLAARCGAGAGRGGCASGWARRTGRRRQAEFDQAAMVAAWGALFDPVVANRA